MSANLSELHSAQLQLNSDQITDKIFISTFNFLCSDMFISSEVSQSDQVTLTWLSIWRSVLEKSSNVQSTKIILHPGVLLTLKSCINNGDNFIVYEAQKVFVELVKFFKSKEATSMILETLRMQNDANILTRYLEICRDLLSKRNPQSYDFLIDISSGLTHISHSLSSGLYEAVSDKMMYAFIAVFFKVVKLVSLHATAESIHILQNTYFFDNKLLIDVLFGTHVRKYAKRKLILALCYFVKPSSLLWRQKSRVECNKVQSAYEIHRHLEPDCFQPMKYEVDATESLESVIIKFGQLYVDRISESGYSCIEDNSGKVTGFVECVSSKGGNPEVDLVFIREWCVLSLGLGVLMSRNHHTDACRLIHLIDNIVKERLAVREPGLFSWLPLLFADQDDMWIDALFMLLNIRKSVDSEGPALHHHMYFLQFVCAIAYDHLVMIDLLTSPETCFLEYLTAYLKYLIHSWSQFVNTAETFRQQQCLEPYTTDLPEENSICTGSAKQDIDDIEAYNTAKSNVTLVSELNIKDIDVMKERSKSDSKLAVDTTNNKVPTSKESFLQDKWTSGNTNNDDINSTNNKDDVLRCTYNSESSITQTGIVTNTVTSDKCFMDPESSLTQKSIEMNTFNMDIRTKKCSGLGLLISSYDDSESDEEVGNNTSHTVDTCMGDMDNTDGVDTQITTKPIGESLVEDICLDDVDNSCSCDTQIITKHVEESLTKGKQVLCNRTCLPNVNDSLDFKQVILKRTIVPSANNSSDCKYCLATTKPIDNHSSDQVDSTNLSPNAVHASSCISDIDFSYEDRNKETIAEYSSSANNDAEVSADADAVSRDGCNRHLESSCTHQAISDFVSNSDSDCKKVLSAYEINRHLECSSTHTMISDNASNSGSNRSPITDEMLEHSEEDSDHNMDTESEDIILNTEFNRSFTDEMQENSDELIHELDKDSEDSDHMIDIENEDIVDRVMGMLIRVSLKLQRMWEHQIIAYNPKALIRLLDNVEQLYSQEDKSE